MEPDRSCGCIGKALRRPHEIESNCGLAGRAAVPDSDHGPDGSTCCARDGSRLVTVEVNGNPRHIVHFDIVAGSEPDENMRSRSTTFICWAGSPLRCTDIRNAGLGRRFRPVLVGLGAQPG